MANYTPTPAQYSRMNAEPYLEGEKFDSMQAAEEYLLSPVCYPSQIISVKKDGEKYYPYIINEKGGAKVLDPIMGDSGGSGGGETDVRNAVVIPGTSLPATATMVPVPGLVPVLQALASGETIPPVFVSVQPVGGSGLSLISPAHFELFNHTGTPSIPQFYYRLEYSIMNGNNPNTLQGEMRRRVMTGTGAFDGESVTLDRRTFYEEQLPYLTGSASKVLTQRGTFVDMPTAPGNATASSDGLMSKEDKAKLDKIAEGANKTVVDSALSTTSTNPVQNKAVKAALDGLAPVFLNMSLITGGTIGADDLAKLKEPESGRPLFFGRFSDSTNQCLSATYNWNGTKLYVTVFSPQPGRVRVENIVYSSGGAYEERKSTEITLNGDGTKFLNDAGQYATIPQQERGTMVFFSDQIGRSEVGKGMGIPTSSVKPRGITPVVGKDIVIETSSGAIGLITSADAQYYWLSYDNGTLLRVPQSGQ